MSANLFIFGLGYSARAIASRLMQRAWRTVGTVRSPEKLERTAASAIRFDDKDSVRAALAGATHLLISAPPGEKGDPALEAYRSEMREAPKLQWVGYLSTIGVYGNHQGGWVDEESAIAPVLGRSAARVEAEQAWIEFCRKRSLPLDIFRLAGIYGPGRSALDRVRERSAQRIVKPGQVFNRIHVDDIAQTVTAAIDRAPDKAPLRIFNVADDEPAPPQDVIAHACQLIGAPLPPEIRFEEAGLSPMARSFYEDNRRVRNGKIKRELGVALLYPTYREGLAAFLKS
jgi:nucleoside-diphosphate-sugar epimerase